MRIRTVLISRRALLVAGLLAILSGVLVASAALLRVESATLATFSLTVELPPPPPTPGCTRSHGYWKDHADQWPVDNLLLGSENYLQEELVELLAQPSVGDASIILAKQQIAAKLNLAAGADGSQIVQTIGNADSWLAGFSGILPYGVSPSSEQGQEALALADVLERYNDGVIGPGPCAEGDGTTAEESSVSVTQAPTTGLPVTPSATELLTGTPTEIPSATPTEAPAETPSETPTVPLGETPTP